MLNFRTKTILGIALIEGTLLIILIWSFLTFFHQSHEQEINQRALSTVKLFATTSKDALLSYDLASLDTYVTELMSNDDIVYVRILVETGTENSVDNNQQTGFQLLTYGGSDSLKKITFKADRELNKVDDGIFDVAYNITESNHIYGRIELGISIARINAVFNQARQWSTSIALLEIFIVAIFSFILGTWLTRQLSLLKVASETITNDGPGFQVNIKGNDEISQVASSFNQMSLNLSDSYYSLKETLRAQKKITEIANSNEAFVSAVLSSSLDAIININEQGIIIEFNHVAEDIFGFTRNEAMGSLMQELIIPLKYRQQYHDGFKKYLETGENNIFNQRLQLEGLHKNGRIFPIELTVSPIINESETIFTSFIRDISEQEQHKEELLLSAVAFEAHEAIFISDTNNNIVRVNKAFSKITGYLSEEVIGKNPSILSSNLHDSSFYRDIWEQINGIGHWEGEIKNKRKNGDIYSEWLGISLVKDEQGNNLYYVAHFIDISKRKEAEQQLTLAKKEAEQASEAKSDFLAVMSHEIRTPMNSILGTLELIQDTPLNEEQDLYVNTANGSASHLLSLINNILDFSKIEAHKLELINTDFDLRQVIDESVSMLSANTKKQNISLNIDIDTNLPLSLYSDRDRIKQVLINLLNNAIKFTHDGSITCKLSCLTIHQDNVHLKVEIIDTGIGISPADQQHLFNTFSQIEQKHNRRFEGTGLGLAISQRLINLLGGKIGVISDTDKGSNFWFTLSIPVSTTALNNITVALSDQPKGKINQSSLSVNRSNNKDIKTMKSNRYKLLLVEDSEANVIVAKSILTKAGYHVDVALNGKLAIELIQENNDKPFELILMDLMMPEMDGAEATKLIRNMSGEISNVPILAMTANAYKADKDYCLDVGMDDYISKPYKSSDLLTKISDMLILAYPITEDSDEQTKSNIMQPIPSPTESVEIKEDIINLAIIKQLEEDTSKDLVPQMVEIFIKELNKRLLNVQMAIKEQKPEDIAPQTHALKSSSGTYGALHLQKISTDLDLACKQKNEADINFLSEQLVKAITLTINTYTKHFSTYG